jgi:hypothetical protein
MNKLIRILLISVLALVVLAGCSAGAAKNTAPTPTAIPGWEKFEGKGVSLWLPDSFEGGNLEEDVATIVEKLKTLGSQYDQVATIIEQNKTMFALWVFDSVVGDEGVLTNVNITTEKVTSAISIDTYLDAATGQFPAEFSVVQRDLITVNGMDAGRLQVDYNSGGVVVKEVMYSIKKGNTIYNITYATGEDEFDQRFPIFEQSAQTFNID